MREQRTKVVSGRKRVNLFYTGKLETSKMSSLSVDFAEHGIASGSALFVCIKECVLKVKNTHLGKPRVLSPLCSIRTQSGLRGSIPGLQRCTWYLDFLT